MDSNEISLYEDLLTTNDTPTQSITRALVQATEFTDIGDSGEFSK